MRVKTIVPVLALVIACAWLFLRVGEPEVPEDGMRIHDFGRLPLVYEGRKKPFDTFARNMLKIISEKETFRDAEGRRRPAVRWLLDTLVDFDNPDSAARKHRIFRIVDHTLLHQLGLEPRKGFRYAIEEFGDGVDGLLEQWRKIAARDREKEPLDVYENNLQQLLNRLDYYQKLSQFGPIRQPSLVPLHVPPVDPDGDWRMLADAVRSGSADDPYVKGWRDMLNAYATGNAEEFNKAVAAYLERLEKDHASVAARVRFESFYNQVDLIMVCTVLYVFAFVLSFLGWIRDGGVLRLTSLHLLWFTFALHTIMLVARVYLSGRAPVTNLYSSALFVGWAGIGVALILEHIYRLGVGNAVAGMKGFSCLLLAPFVGGTGDTMAVMQAVLDTNFWLWTHVTCITLGYATTYIAGFLGAMLILRGTMTRTLTPEIRRTLADMTYGVTCFAMFFSFVGTVLGGLWADDSWGRFWGWDPKENGALMIVIWNAVMLHARWGGIVRERGFANLAIFGNMIVTWSWFGTNQLGAGLHAYGFTDGMWTMILGVLGAHALVMIVGMLPEKLWATPPVTRASDAAGR